MFSFFSYVPNISEISKQNHKAFVNSFMLICGKFHMQTCLHLSSVKVLDLNSLMSPRSNAVGLKRINFKSSHSLVNKMMFIF